MTIDPVDLTRRLVRCASVTPADNGALDVVAEALEALGMDVTRLIFGPDHPGPDNQDASKDTQPVHNLFATMVIDSDGMIEGDGDPASNTLRHLAFNGHTDVVPPGNTDEWRFDPFSGEIDEGCLFGRGATDMKSGVACFIAALSRVIAARDEGKVGRPARISFMITGDEEGLAHYGSKPLAAWAHAEGYRFDGCLVGEPTSRLELGDNAKIGRRGSATAELTVYGVQGHTAYGHNADNAATSLVGMLSAITQDQIDQGTQHFQPTSLEITTIDIGNPAANIIPGKAFARFNMRYNESQTVSSIEQWLRSRLDHSDRRYELNIVSSGDAFVTSEGPLTEALSESVLEITGRKPAFSTDGGTSDARFIRHYCPVVEFGLTGKTMHRVDEHVAIDEIETLTQIYERFIERFWEQGRP